jgi:hypothetical protein
MNSYALLVVECVSVEKAGWKRGLLGYYFGRKKRRRK